MEVVSYLRSLRRWTWLIVLCPSLAAVVAAVISVRTPPVYEARATLLVRPALALAGPAGDTSLTPDQVSRTYAELLVQRPVLARVIADRRLAATPDELLRSVSVTAEPGTTILTVAVRDSRRERAQATANTLVDDFIAQSGQAQQRQAQQYVAQIERQVQDLGGTMHDEQARLDELNASAGQRPLASGEQTEVTTLQERLSADRAQYADLLRNLADIQTQNARLADSVSVIAPADLPDRPVWPLPGLVTALAACAGLAAALIAVLVLEHLDQSITSEAELQRRAGLTSLGRIWMTPAGREGELTALGPRFATVEGYKALRTNLLFSGLDREVRSIVVTSPSANEGKSRTAANLAVVLAQAGHRTALVDADFRRPSQHRIFRRVRNVGLSNLVLHDVPEDECVRPVDGLPNLFLVTAGTQPPNPSEVMGSAPLKALQAWLRRGFAYVIWDTPPVNVVTDASVLAAGVDGTLLVVEHGRTTYAELAHAQRALGQVGAGVLGVVMNKVRASREDGYGYYRYHYHSTEDGGAPPGDGTLPAVAAPAGEADTWLHEDGAGPVRG